jgi:predicted TIM-barrel fold metal-dependent hydrolase
MLDEEESRVLDAHLTSVVDCDAHVELGRVEDLIAYFPPQWVEHVQNTQFNGPRDSYYPPLLRAAPPGKPTSLDSLATAVSRGGVDLALLHCPYAVDALHNPDQAIAVCRAVNDWMLGEFLERDDRLRGSIIVPPQFPDLAAEEIRRLGGRPEFVEVLLPARSESPYGNRRYLRVWEAAAEQSLVVGLHFGGAPGNPPTPAGWPSHYAEDYVNMAAAFATQMTSLVVEGVFEVHPALRFTLHESGVSWLPAHLWVMDHEWKNMRRLVPWVKRAPSEYVEEHFRLTTQPFDGPDDPRQVGQLLDQLGGARLLLFAADPLGRATGDSLDAALRNNDDEFAAFMGSNALSWYRIREPR